MADKKLSNRAAKSEPGDFRPELVTDRNGEVDVGKSLRKLREEQRLTIRGLAGKSGLAVNTLSLIENGKTSPSVSTLQQLAVALGVPITAFFETDGPELKVVFLRAGSRQGAGFESGILEDLGKGMRGNRMEPFVLTLQAHSDSGPQPVVHNGQEFVYCLEGRLIYEIEDQIYRLEPGDSLLFEAHLPHRWRNPESVPSRSLLVLCPSEERGRPVERHFSPDRG
jgi:transcriptional regulator with XRE-family HTH domain